MMTMAVSDTASEKKNNKIEFEINLGVNDTASDVLASTQTKNYLKCRT